MRSFLKKLSMVLVISSAILTGCSQKPAVEEITVREVMEAPEDFDKKEIVVRGRLPEEKLEINEKAQPVILDETDRSLQCIILSEEPDLKNTVVQIHGTYDAKTNTIQVKSIQEIK